MNCFGNKYLKSFINYFKYGIILFIVPPILNYAALQRETPVLSTHGLHYDVGFGQKMFLSCKGNGVPTVLMDAPIGLTSDYWVPLQEKLSSLTRVCVYDRAGLGFSERPFDQPPSVNMTAKERERARLTRGQEFTIERMVEDLRRLISSASPQERPIVFVGSGLGAMIGRFYSQIYEGDISHLVLVDPLVENLFDINDSIWKSYWYEHLLVKLKSMAIGAVLGWNRVFLMLGFIDTQIDPSYLLTNPDISNRQKHLACNSKHIFSSIDEHYYMNESFAQMKYGFNGLKEQLIESELNFVPFLRLVKSLKQFPQNISVTIVTGKDENNYDVKSSNDLQKSIIETREFLLKHLHSNAQHAKYDTIKINEILNGDSNYLLKLCSNLIVDWRKKVKNLNLKVDKASSPPVVQE